MNKEMFKHLRAVRNHCAQTTCKECAIYDWCNSWEVHENVSPQYWSHIEEDKDEDNQEG